MSAGKSPGTTTSTRLKRIEYRIELLSESFKRKPLAKLAQNVERKSPKRGTAMSRLRSQPAPKHETFSLEDFELGRILGKGKLGKVYCAKHKESDFVVALKVMSKKDLVDLKLEKNFRREIEIQSRLIHPKISRLYGYFHDETNVYLILEYSIYGELYHHLKAQKRFNNILALFYINQVAQALVYLHSKNIIHRDIKPENILLSFNNTIKLSDFGWSVQTSKSRGILRTSEFNSRRNTIENSYRITKDSNRPRNTGETPRNQENKRLTICGTLDYLPPEMIESSEHGHAVDNWALGVLCYEFLVGKPPFEEVDKNATYKRIAKVDLRIPSYIDDDAKDLMIRLLQRDPAKRLSLQLVLTHPWLEKNRCMWPVQKDA